MIDALDGAQLEADLVRVDNACVSVVLTHPHPLYGGDRFNPVIDALFHALPDAGFTTIRFDFRGVNNSSGSHDDGDSERLDVVAALELLDLVDPDSPVWLVGYSFGAFVALNVLDPRVAGWVAVAPPLATMKARCLADRDHRTKLLLVPEHDQFSPPVPTADFTSTWVACTQQNIVMADHFLNGHTSAVAGIVRTHLTGQA